MTESLPPVVTATEAGEQGDDDDEINIIYDSRNLGTDNGAVSVSSTQTIINQKIKEEGGSSLYEDPEKTKSKK